MGDDVKMSANAAAPIIDHFRVVRDELETMSSLILTRASLVDNACGEFGPAVADGSTAFQLSWRGTLTFCAETSALIAGNTNVFEVELERLDNELAQIPTI